MLGRPLVAILAVIAASGCAGTRHLDPPPPPPAVIPPVPAPQTPLPEGMSRVIFDVVDGPSELQLKTMQPSGAVWKPMCTTPCIVDLFPGRIEASFALGGRGDTTSIDVVPGTSVYRRQLVERESSPALLVAGYAVGYTGLSTLLLGLMVSALENVDNPGRTTHVGQTISLVGLGMSVGGGLMFYYGWPSERSASVTQFSLPEGR